MKPSHLLTAAWLVASFSAAQAVELAPLSGSNLGKVTGGDFKKKAHAVIQKRCTVCHGKEVIREAIAAGKDMQKIQGEMEKKGAALSANDRQVLGIYWNQTPLKEKK
ncbi:MAG TPA: cytochrome C [Geomonas sp.]